MSKEKTKQNIILFFVILIIFATVILYYEIEISKLEENVKAKELSINFLYEAIEYEGRYSNLNYLNSLDYYLADSAKERLSLYGSDSDV